MPKKPIIKTYIILVFANLIRKSDPVKDGSTPEVAINRQNGKGVGKKSLQFYRLHSKFYLLHLITLQCGISAVAIIKQPYPRRISARAIS